MNRLRAHLRLGSCAALFALAFQLVLAFGHVHLDYSDAHFSTRIERASGAPATAGHDVPGVADDYCGVCALIHLAGSLVPTEAAALRIPVVFRHWRCPDAALCFLLPAAFPLPFAARAPPLA
jgi:hypothetical protein